MQTRFFVHRTGNGICCIKDRQHKDRTGNPEVVALFFKSKARPAAGEAMAKVACEALETVVTAARQTVNTKTEV